MRIITNIVLFLLPFAVFFAYAHVANRRRAIDGGDPLRTPWYWLVIAGLGLAIVKHLARAHGGEAYVTSDVGVGSEFSITLPVVAQTESAPRALASAAAEM